VAEELSSKYLNMKVSKELLWETASFIKEYMNSQSAASFPFHNYNRSLNVVQSCSQLVVNLDLGKYDRMMAMLSAWFLETGYCKDYGNPQHEAALLAGNFLTAKGLDPDDMQAVAECILSVRKPQQPLTIVAQVLCDADNKWLSDKEFPFSLEKLRKEMNMIEGKTFSDEQWKVKVTQEIETQIYFTAAAKDLYDKRKRKNIKHLHGKPDLDSPEQIAPSSPGEPSGTARDTTISYEDFKPERSVESLFRNTSRNQMRWLQLADYKANLVIGVNALIISVVLSIMITKLDSNQYLELPTLLLLITSVSTIILALTASRPNIKLDKLGGVRFDKLEKNMLFFGHFYQKTLSEYKEIIKETITHKPELYSSLSRDIYYQGLLILVKFRYLLLAYNIFATGLVVSVLGFIISFLVHHSSGK
jgi:predicted metal-dependent HD superfamily phosphohydrolase